MTLKELIALHGFGKWFKHNADTNYEFMPLRFSSIRPHLIIGEINRGYNPATCFSENDEGWELKEEFKLDPAKFTWASSFGSVGGGPGGGGVGNKEEPKPIRIELPQNPTITWTCKCGYSHSLNFACDKCGMKVGGYAGTGCAVSPSPEKPKVKRAQYLYWPGVKVDIRPQVSTSFYKDEDDFTTSLPVEGWNFIRLTETEREFDF